MKAFICSLFMVSSLVAATFQHKEEYIRHVGDERSIGFQIDFEMIKLETNVEGGDVDSLNALDYLDAAISDRMVPPVSLLAREHLLCGGFCDASGSLYPEVRIALLARKEELKPFFVCEGM